MSDEKKEREPVWGIDHAFRRDTVYGLHTEPTYSGALSFLRLKYAADPAGLDVAVTGVPFDLAVTNRPGTRFGPRAIRASSSNLAWMPQYPWIFDPFQRLAVADVGDLAIEHGKPHQIPDQIEAHIAGLLDGGAKSTLTMGGDHFITLPILRAYAKKHGPMAIVHFDAHSDTWAEDENRIDHGSMFFHGVKDGIIDPKRSVQIGIRTHNPDPMGITWLDAWWVHENGVEKTISEVKRIVGDAPAYLTFDIDCLDPAFAPGTGTPVIGGLSSHQARRILCGLDGIDFKGMDLVEVAPQYDVGEVTSLAGASLMYDYLHMMAQDKPLVDWP